MRLQAVRRDNAERPTYCPLSLSTTIATMYYCYCYYYYYYCYCYLNIYSGCFCDDCSVSSVLASLAMCQCSVGLCLCLCVTQCGFPVCSKAESNVSHCVWHCIAPALGGSLTGGETRFTMCTLLPSTSASALVILDLALPSLVTQRSAILKLSLLCPPLS